jgi:hypothetical protein
MALTVQVVIDSNDPHPLAAWWAQTLGWNVEPQDPDFIRRMVAEGHASEDDTMEYEGSLVWRVGAAINHPDPDSGTPRILFQWVPEPKTAKNRAHLDLRADGEDLEALRARLVERGATVLHEGRQGPQTWLTMADPQGNEFCV